MTNIDKNNIEKWLFDYHEGNLNQEETEALEKFILLNPEYEAEMDAWSMAFVENEEFEYHNTDSLYQKKRRIGWIGWSSAAAVLLSGIVLSFLFLNQNSNATVSQNSTEMNSDSPATLVESASVDQNGNSNKDLVSNSNNNPTVNPTYPSDEIPTDNDQLVENGIQAENPNKIRPNVAIEENVAIKKEENLAIKKANNSNPKLYNQNKFKNNKKYSADENLVVAQQNLKADQLDDSNGQNHADENDFAVNNLKMEELNIKDSKDELVSAIPGKTDQFVNNDEFAHLEPVTPELEKDITLNQALDKLDYDSGDYKGAYISNPQYSSSKIDLSENLKNSSRKTTTKFIRDIKRAFNNPAGVTNLRDPNLVLPGYNPLAFNPSLAGGTLKTRIQTSYMNQWTGTSQMQHMAQLSVDGYIYGLRGGLGMNIQFKDFANGMYRNYDASLIYSPKINFGKFLTIEPSLKFNMGAYTLDKDKVIPGGQIEMERGNIYQTFESGENPIGKQKMYYDLGVGLFVNTKWFYAGFSMDNVFRHKENIFSNDIDNPRKAPFRINAVVGTDFQSRNKNFSGSPYIVYQHYDHFDEFYFGANFRFFWGTAGVSISDKGNISAQAGIQFKKFKMYYQYDWTKSKLMGIKGHSHEVMFRFTIKPKRSFSKNLEY
ncbi:MAG: PorP/SprF family type IX secretion system membrane protein [Crocinitomicaceae bacterium]|nr:PorP/SprF family type IX secretion system membrane protein [Crocinitomicaceae bacterium]